MTKFKNPKLHDFSLQAGGSHYPSVNTAQQEQMSELIIDACIRAITHADVRHMVRTTWEEDFAGAVKQACIKSVREALLEINNG